MHDRPVIFFLPFHHHGGAEKVHERVVSSLPTARVTVFFTHTSSGVGYLPQFRKAARTLHIEPLLRSKFSKRVVADILARWINRMNRPVVIGCNTKFYYELLPKLSDHVYCIDIIHGLGSNIENSTLPFVPKIDKRIVVCKQVREGLQRLYAGQNLPEIYHERISVIGNYAELPDYPLHKDYSGPLKLLYVGRGFSGKRVHLIGRLARKCHERGLDVVATLVGGLDGEIDEQDRRFCRFVEIKDRFEDFVEFYRETHVFVMMSLREGMPLALLDAMGYGLVPVVTAVGGIPENIVQRSTGFLFDPDLPEETLLDEMVNCLAELSSDRTLLARVSSQAASAARENFGRKDFEIAWKMTVFGGAPCPTDGGHQLSQYSKQ